ncbi:Scramblase-domain-containing protein [Gamsiella multidivaricata]|uniref:Scramblase-domain-containing protein n=1 Tax=Gamsiella multidivaricata TaxID=101098 RepID=UPI0022205834|nr:Scramblase-domain-containing protein [Gamsiella multidivaricata]KAI7831790.1 Scramblase-domain-containing protein [Gamsiella multidivaricata]
MSLLERNVHSSGATGGDHQLTFDRTAAPSRANTPASTPAPTAGTASVLSHGAAAPDAAGIPQEQAPSNMVQGLDIAATPAVIPEDPFGVLQPHDTAYKLLAQPALIMTRQIEMMNVLVGFEQANKYAIVDPSGAPIGYIAEEDTTIMKAMSRQLLHTHRPFKASVLDLEGNEVLKIHRPFAFINSRIMISTPDDRLIGEVQQEWHLIRRRYNLFTIEQQDTNEIQRDSKTTAISTERDLSGHGLTRVQFAHIDGGFLALDFDMQDEQGQRMASVNRNFVGFARELFTDSGQYALRFDAAVIQDLQQEQGLGATPAATSTLSGTSEQDLQQAKEIQANKDEKALAQLESRGGLTLDQRAIMLACAVSIDFDYFSRHSGNGGIMPVPMMMGGGHAPVPSSSSDNPMGTVVGAGAGAGAGHVLGGAAAGDVAGGAAGGMPTPPPMPSAPPATGGGAWGEDMPAGTSTDGWSEDVWSEESADSGDSWFGGDKGEGGGGGGDGDGFDWGDLL